MLRQRIVMKARSCLLAVLLTLTSLPAGAQTFPDRPITLIVPFVAGGGADAFGRLVAQFMSKPLNQSVIVENVGGAGGTLGAGRGARAEPDGYTLTLTSLAQAASATLYRKLAYDPIGAFEPIGIIGEVPMAIVGPKDALANDATGLIAQIKTKKDAVSMAHGGLGSASHLCGMLFMNALKTRMNVVPYKSAAPALNDVIGGRIDVMCDQTASTIEQIKGGNVKGFAVTTKTRLPSLPELPTVTEAGLPGVELGIWFGLLAPKGTPKPIIDRLASALKVAIADPAFISRFRELGAELSDKELSEPARFEKFFREEAEKWRPIIIESGAYAD
jgi:tripartite-type tricarboxylate transporter receptor subunit TctC